MRMWRKYGLVYGISAIAVIFCSGCASTSRQMSYADINYFKMDCSKRNEQIQMLQSMQSTEDDRLLARVRVATQPWLQFTDPDQFTNDVYLGSGRTDAYIQYQIQDLVNFCPGKQF